MRFQAEKHEGHETGHETGHENFQEKAWKEKAMKSNEKAWKGHETFSATIN